MSRVIDEFTDEDAIFSDAPAEPNTRSGLSSVYDQFRSELSKPVEAAATFVHKPKGREIGVRFSTDLPLEKLERWRKVAAKKAGKADTDVLQLAYLVLAGQAQCFVMNGEDVVDDNGEQALFRSKDVHEALKVLDYQGAIHAFYGSDPEVLRASGEVLEKCGWGDDDYDYEEDDEDPLD